MTTSQPAPTVTSTFTVEDAAGIAGLVGPSDAVLRAVEAQFPGTDIHLRGNAFTLHGQAGEVALAERLIAQLLEVAAAGQPLSPEAVARSAAMLRQDTHERPADVLTLNIFSSRKNI